MHIAFGVFFSCSVSLTFSLFCFCSRYLFMGPCPCKDPHYGILPEDCRLRLGWPSPLCIRVKKKTSRGDRNLRLKLSWEHTPAGTLYRRAEELDVVALFLTEGSRNQCRVMTTKMQLDLGTDSQRDQLIHLFGSSRQ